jgi:ubiquitin carboxyl-terminal hydrolase 4/11/15
VVANHASDGWPTPRSNAQSSPTSTPPPLEDTELPSFDKSQYDELVNASLDPLQIASQRYDLPDSLSKPSPIATDLDYVHVGSHWDLPDSSSKASPTSSNEAEPDLDSDHNGHDWSVPRGIVGALQGLDSSQGWEESSALYSDSSSSDAHPLADLNTGEEQDKGAEEIPVHKIRP